MIKFTLPMKYFDSQNAVYYLDTTTGHAAIYHESAKYWGYKHFPDDEIVSRMTDA